MKKLLILLFLPIFSFSQQSLTFQHGGLTREYILYKPVNLPINAPLVFVFHGYGGDGQTIMNYSNMNTIADQNGFAVCYPEGTLAWGDQFFDVGYDFINWSVDDVGFSVALANYLQTTHQLDPYRTFSTGLSNGGDISYMLACQASTTFRAIAPVAGMILANIYNNCNATVPIPVFEIHGTVDNVTFYNGDMTNSGGWGAYLSIPATIDYFKTKNNLTDLFVDTLPDIDPNDGSIIERNIYSSPNTTNEVWLYKVIGGGHDWPGSWGNMDVDISQEIWNFFDQMSQTITAIDEMKNINKKLLKITDILGRETIPTKNTPLFYIYDDGTVEKKIIID
ncbi:MAG: prolyl oligopeptidase family serine peptidase [Flavobacteriales bacterium]|nr:prolyl oligopeptidase family serine peptidase [Flavobacteriales bacterium]